MSNKTISDIIAEKRNRANEIERDVAAKMANGEMLSDLYARELIADMRREAERLEAAAKRECGNAAAMREALEKCVDLILRFGNAELVETPLEVIIDIETILKAALSAPPKNCDVGSAEEQVMRFDAFVRDRRGDLNCTGKCPAHNGVDFGVVRCVLQWAQMPYEEGGAERARLHRNGNGAGRVQ